MGLAYPCSPVATTRRTILHLRPGQMPCSPLKPCWTRYSGTHPRVNSAPSRALLTAATIRVLDSAVCGFPTRLSTVLLTWLMQKTPLSMNLTELFFSPLPRIWIRPRTLPSLLPYGRSPRSPSRARSRCSAWACSVSAQRDAVRTERRTALAGCMEPAAYRTEHALSDRRVTVHSGHIGNTFRPLRETQSAVAGVLQDGRASAVCGSVTRRREDGGAVPRVRYLAQDRLQDLCPIPGLRPGRAHRSVTPAVPAGQPPALPDRGADRATEEGAPELGRAEDPREAQAPGPRHSDARDQHRARRARSAWAGEPRSPNRASPSDRDRSVDAHAAERSLVHRLQGRVHARRSALLLSAHPQRLRQPLPAVLRCPGEHARDLRLQRL